MKKRIIALFMAAVMMMGTPMPVNAAEVETTEQGDSLEREFIDNFFKKDSENTEQEEEASTEEKESEDVSEEELETEEVEEEETVKEEAEEESKEEAINKVESIKLVDWNADKKALDSINVTESKYEGDYRNYDTSAGVTYQVVGIVMYDAEDNQVSVSDANIEASDVAYEVVKKVDDSYEVVSEEASPVKLVREDGQFECLVDGKTASENEFYLQATLNASEYTEECTVTVPIVVAENPSASFVEPTTYCATKEEAYAAVRDIITNRVNKLEDYRASNYRSYQDGAYVYDRIAVAADAVADSELSLLDICDFYEEREDMNAWEGDYLLGYIGSNNAVDFTYTNPSIYTENDEVLHQVTTDDVTYNVYEIYLPVMTTKSQEEAVDKKIEELKATEFEGYDLWLNEDKIKAIYDYLTETVSDDVDVDGTNPTYHTAYSVLVDGIGTADAYALAFTRLSRELGVKSRVIMGVDSGAHAYNIVELDEGFWYFLDCSAGIYLTGTSFERAEELERYSDERFVKNYLKLVVKDNLLGAADKPITVSAVKSLTDSTAEKLEKTGFDKWEDAVKYLNSRNNKNNVYTIKLNDKVEVTGKLTFPKAALVKVTSDPKAPKKLIYSGDIAPSCDVAFSNVILATENKKAKLVAGTHKVEFNNVTSNELATVTSTGAGQLVLTNSNVVSTGAISLSNLKMTGGTLISNTAGITVSNLADLTGAKINVKTTVSFKNIISNDGNNSITYGTDYKNAFKITGTINADKTPSQMQVSVGSKKINVSTYALSIVPKYLSANGYKDAKQYENKTIVTAKQVPACYVVIGKSGNTIKHALRKSHDALVLDLNPDRAVELIENGNITLGRFDTLTEAINEIVKIGNATKSYKLKIYTDVATKADKKPSTELDNLIIPANAKDVTIESANGVYGLKLNNTITLKTDLTLTNIKLEDHIAKNGTNVKLNFNLGKSKLTLNNVTVNKDSDRIGRIYGNGVAGTSGLILNQAGSLNDENKLNLIVSGNLENVGEVNLKSSSLAVLGKTNIGMMTCKGKDLRVFVGSANVTTKKINGKVIVTSVKSNVTINEIYSESMGTKGGRNLAVSLLYYSGNKLLEEFDGYDDSMFTRAKAGYQILKGSRVYEKQITYVDDSGKCPDTYVDRKKNGALYLLAPTTVKTRYELRYEYDVSKPYIVIGHFDTLKEIIDEINARKIPNATYNINVSNNEIETYESLPMPKEGCAKKIIFGNDLASQSLFLKNTNFKLSSDLYFCGMQVYTKKPIAFNIGTHELDIYNTHFVNDYDWNKYGLDKVKDRDVSIIKSVTGAGETKINKDGTYMSTLSIEGGLSVDNDVTKVGCVQLGIHSTYNSGSLSVDGNISIGEVKYAWANENDSEIAGMATLKKNGKKITGVTTKINIVNGIKGVKKYDNDVPYPLHIELGCMYKGYDVYVEDFADPEVIKATGISFADSLLNGDKLQYELFKTKNAMYKDKDGNPLFTSENTKSDEIVRKGDKFYRNKKLLQTVPGYTVKNAIGETAGTFITYADAVAAINNNLPVDTKYTIIANKEDATKQHKAETYTLPSAKKAPQFELQGDGMELNYLGRAGMNLNVGNNQKVIVNNIKFKADKTGKKPVNITVGKSSEFKASNTTIDNLNNITGKSSAEKGVVTFSPTQLYSGTINANVKATGLNKINKK